MAIEAIYGRISLLDLVAEECRNSADFPAVVLYADDKKSEADKREVYTLTFADTWKCVEDHQSWLTKKIEGFRRSSSRIRDFAVVYLSSNSVDMLLSMLACTGARGCGTDAPIVALLNIRWSEDEMATALQSKNPSDAETLILYGDGFEMIAEQVCRKLGHLARKSKIPQLAKKYMKCSTNGSHIMKSRSRHSKRLNIQDLQEQVRVDDAMIVFTSGTTGGSKGVRLGHRALAVQSVAKQLEPCRYSSTTTMLASTVPLFHIGGISSCVGVLLAGGALIFPDPEVRFDVRRTILSLAHPRMPTNTLVVVPAMLTALLKELAPSIEYPHVDLILIGGQSASKPIVDVLQKVFPNARIVQTFACTEAASSLTFLHVNADPKKMSQAHGRVERPNDIDGDCVGVPPPHVNLRLYRKDGNVNKIVNLPYQSGLIATRGPHVMNGYWTRGIVLPPSPPTHRIFTGWYVTSDLGYFDDSGQLYFSGRSRDTIRSGGETIMAQEVERVLMKNPNIVECAVFAKPDDRFGEAVACAIVVSKQQQDHFDLHTIKHWCEQENLASYKRPRYVYLVDSLPRNASGKVLKHLLIERFRGRRRIQSRL